MTGYGVVSGFGRGRSALWEGMRAGRTAIRPVQRFDTTGFASGLAALVPGTDEPRLEPRPTGRGQALMVDFAVEAGREALVHAGLVGGPRLGLVLGTNVEDRPDGYHVLVERIGDRLGVGGPRVVTSIACASSASALAFGASLVERGDVDAVLAGGSDAITPWVMAGFHVVGVLSAGPCAPFGVPLGMSLGEGACLLVLERAESARARGARVHTVLCGAGLAADGHHATSPAPDGRGIAAALRRAGGPFGYVNAHGTGTEANDAPEVLGVRAALGEVPMSSGKGLIGHAQGAAAALEIATVLLAAEHGLLPPTWGTTALREGAPADPVVGGLRPGAPERWAAVSAAFGGTNVALAFDAVGVQPGPPSRVFLGGLSAVGPHGVGVEGLEAGWRSGGIFHRVDAEKLARRSDLSREDDSGVLAVVAAQLALQDAGVRVQRENRERIGLVTGLAHASEGTQMEFQRQIDARGLTQVLASTFARASMVASGGLVSRELGLRGPLDVVCAGGLSALVALVRAAELVAGGGLDGALAVSVCEKGRWTGGVGAWLSTGPSAVGISGWALGGADALEATVARAGGHDWPRVVLDDDPSGVAGGIALARARALCEREGTAMLVGSAAGQLSVAVALRSAGSPWSV